jgi:hypothetical protein
MNYHRNTEVAMNPRTLIRAATAGLLTLLAAGSPLASPAHPLGPSVDTFGGTIGEYHGQDAEDWDIDVPSDGELATDEPGSGGGSTDDDEDGIQPFILIRSR